MRSCCTALTDQLALTNQLVLTDQLALNRAIYLQGLFKHTEMLPAWCNWPCHNALPHWHEERRLLVEPYLPHTQIGVVHLTTRDKKSIRRITTTAGKKVEIRITFPPGPVAAAPLDQEA